MERVQSDEYETDVWIRILFQPAAQQLERVQGYDYEMDVLGRNILQRAAPRSLVVEPRRIFLAS